MQKLKLPQKRKRGRLGKRVILLQYIKRKKVTEFQLLENKMASLKELKRRLERERKKAEEKQEIARLKKELFLVKNVGLVSAGKSISNVASRVGGRLSSAGRQFVKTATPAIKRQARLIREQQIREDNLYKKMSSSKKKKTKKVKGKKKGKTKSKSKKKSFRLVFD